MKSFVYYIIATLSHRESTYFSVEVDEACETAFVLRHAVKRTQEVETVLQSIRF